MLCLVGLWLLPIGVGAAAPTSQEPWNSGWSLAIDNDLFSFLATDQQYTGGLALTLSGARARQSLLGLDSALAWVDDQLPLPEGHQGAAALREHSFTSGFTAFTPKDIGAAQPILDDRPYAGLVFISNTRQTPNRHGTTVYLSNLMLGLLGTDLVPALQQGLHGALGNDIPRGWDNQIADGGELTLKYSFATQRLLREGTTGHALYQVGDILGYSLGTTTELGLGIGGRWGTLEVPWWHFTPVFGDYIHLGTPVSEASGTGGLVLWGGLMLRLRLYNALLQGQLRDNPVEYSADQLNPVMADLVIGISQQTSAHWGWSFSLRARTPEIKQGQGDPPLWGSLSVHRSLGN